MRVTIDIVVSTLPGNQAPRLWQLCCDELTARVTSQQTLEVGFDERLVR
jgi:hypothetical protein